MDQLQFKILVQMGLELLDDKEFKEFMILLGKRESRYMDERMIANSKILYYTNKMNAFLDHELIKFENDKS